MLITDHAAGVLDADPHLKKLFLAFPNAFFGKIIKYPKQAQIIREYLTYDNNKMPKICVITGWKRVAKTAIGAYLGSCWITGKLDKEWPGAKEMKIPYTYIWKRRVARKRTGIVGGKSLEHVETVLLKQYRDLIPPQSVKEWFSRSKHRIVLHDAYGSEFLVRTYDQDIGQWKSGEAQFVHLDEEPPYEVMQEVMERTRTSKGRILITVAIDDADVSWLPDACENPMKYFGTTSFLHFKMGVEDVPTDIYPEEEKEIVYRQYDHTPLRRAVRYGEWAYMSGKWWMGFTKDIHVIPAFQIPENWKRFRAVDAGVAAPSACIWAAIHPRYNIIFIYREYYKTGTTIDERCSDIIEMSGNRRKKDGFIWVEEEIGEKFEQTLLDHAEFKTDQVTGDAMDYHYVKAGLCVQPSTTLGQEARREIIMKWLKVDMNEKHFITHEKGAPHLYIFDTCSNLIWEAQTKCVKKTYSDKSGTFEKKIDNKNDHATDCGEFLVSELQWMMDGKGIV